MRSIKAAAFFGFVVAGVAFSHAQTEAPKNLAGAEFPCNYAQSPSAYTMTAKFLETINDATFVTGFQLDSTNLNLRAETAICQPSGECELSGKVTVRLGKSQPTPAKPAAK